MRSLGCTAAALTAAIVAASAAHAHKVQLFAIASGKQVVCRGFFSRGSPARDCRVTVSLPDGRKLLEGKTDERGRFVFDASVRADLTISLHAGEGHQREFVLKADKLPADLPTPGGAAPPSPGAKAAAPRPAPPPRSAPMDEQQIRGVVRAAVQEGLLPLREEIALSRHRGPNLTEIIGGIGYIIGLMGVVLYFRSRARGRGSSEGA